MFERYQESHETNAQDLEHFPSKKLLHAYEHYNTYEMYCLLMPIAEQRIVLESADTYDVKLYLALQEDQKRLELEHLEALYESS